MVESTTVTSAMKSNFSDPDAVVEFARSVNKLTRHNDLQERFLVAAGEHLYLFGKDSKGSDKLQRRHRVIKMAAFIFSKTSSEVVFCFPEAKDLRFCGL